MRKRPTIEDLAQAAGVSVATVDRVLNRRLPVREDTAQRVLAAAETIGYHATTLLKQRLRADAPARTLGFLLQKRDDPFYQALAADLAAATRRTPAIRGRPIIEFMDELTPAVIVERLRAVGARADALAVVAVDHPHVTQAIADLRAGGVPTFALLSDLTAGASAGYIGLDSRKAGRTAAWAIAHAAPRPGRIGIIVGSHRYLCQDMAEISFRSYFREHAPAFSLLEPLVNLDDPRIAYEATAGLLSRQNDLVGLYIAGGGMEGAIQAVRDDAGDHRRLAMVCNELTPQTRRGLIDRIVTMVIATPTAAVAEKAVGAMIDATTRAQPHPPIRTCLPFDLFISENV